MKEIEITPNANEMLEEICHKTGMSREQAFDDVMRVYFQLPGYEAAEKRMKRLQFEWMKGGAN